MRIGRAGLVGLAGLAPSAAAAHTFSTEADAWGYFLEGVVVVLMAPELVLPIAALAIALVLWERGGFLRAWPYYLVASHVGLFVAVFAGIWAQVVPPLGIGLVVAVLAALVPLKRIGPALPWLAALIGLAVVVAVLGGYRVTDIPLGLLAGVIVAANAGLAVLAALVRLTLIALPFRWVTILWRVVASWLAAIMMLYLAFLLAG